MTKAEIIAAFGGDAEPKPSAPKDVAKDVSPLEEQRLKTAFFDNKDAQKAFFDSLAVLRDIKPEKFRNQIGNSTLHAVCLAESFSLLGLEARLFGFTFTKAGYFPCSLVVSPKSAGLCVPVGFACDKLTPWDEEFSPSVVVAKAKKLLELYESIGKKCCLIFQKQSPVDIATAIVNAVNALED